MTAVSPHVLIVEDDEEIATLVAKYLGANEYRVTNAREGREMQRVLHGGGHVDLMVLDLNLPGEDGLSICRRLRGQDSRIPIIILTARGEDIDRIIGLELGADDYLAKPFNPRELLARIRAVLRRLASEPGQRASKTHAYMFSGWRLDTMSRELLSPEGARVALTGAEFDLLHALCEKAGRILSRDQLLDLTQGRFGGPYERSIDVLISRIRQKIERDPKAPEIIKTVRSEGYLFTPRVDRG